MVGPDNGRGHGFRSGFVNGGWKPFMGDEGLTSFVAKSVVEMIEGTTESYKVVIVAVKCGLPLFPATRSVNNTRTTR